MAEEQSSQERSEEPTPKKLQKAREEGQVARSRELTSTALVISGAATLYLLAPAVAAELSALLRNSIELAADPDGNFLRLLDTALLQGMAVTLPLILIPTVCAALSMVATGGLVFSTQQFTPKSNRISPISGFKRMFSMKSLMELAKSVGKFVLVTGIAVFVLSLLMDRLLVLGALPLVQALAQSLEYVGLAVLALGFGMIVIAAVDVPFQIAQHSKQLRMTKQEVKDELKDSEGRPEVRSRIRQLQQEISQRKMLTDVPQADVIITNPEHYSVALKYDAEAMGAPRVLAKGADHMALRIREIGAAHGVPQLAVPPLTRALYHASDVGDEVPEPLYVAVAQVIAYVYQLAMFRRGELRQAPVLGTIDIPPDYARDP